MKNNLRDHLKELYIEENTPVNTTSGDRFVAKFNKNIVEPIKQRTTSFKNSVIDAKRIREIQKRNEQQRSEYARKIKELEVQKQKSGKPVEFTKAHAIGGAMLVTALGLGAHSLYKKYKRNKEERKKREKEN